MRRLRPRRLGWRTDVRGATAVEFALIGPLFLMLVMACIEFGIQLMTQLDLDNATEAAARQIEIGQANDRTSFADVVCTNASVLLTSCASKLQVYVASGSTFAGLTPAAVKSGTLTPSGFTPGGSQSAVLVQVAYTRPYDVQWLTSLFGTTPTLVSTVAIQNEPPQAS